MTTTASDHDHIQYVHLDTEAIDRRRFLDAAALAAVEATLTYWMDASPGNYQEAAICDSWTFAYNMLAERTRRRDAEKEGKE